MLPSPAISESQIQELVHRFYAKARRDSEIGPVFNRVVADWDAHLENLTAFWSSVMLTSGRYKGNPMAAHLRLKDATPAHFARWLALFRETAEEIFPPDVSSAFVMRAENIARSLQLGMFYRASAHAPAKPAPSREHPEPFDDKHRSDDNADRSDPA